jgi:hypothetical protein
LRGRDAKARGKVRAGRSTDATDRADKRIGRRCLCRTAARKNAAGSGKGQSCTFAATFFLACLAAMELEGVGLEEI